MKNLISLLFAAIALSSCSHSGAEQTAPPVPLDVSWYVADPVPLEISWYVSPVREIASTPEAKKPAATSRVVCTASGCKRISTTETRPATAGTRPVTTYKSYRNSRIRSRSYLIRGRR